MPSSNNNNNRLVIAIYFQSSFILIYLSDHTKSTTRTTTTNIPKFRQDAHPSRPFTHHDISIIVGLFRELFDGKFVFRMDQRF